MRFIKISIFFNLIFVSLSSFEDNLYGQEFDLQRATKIIQKQKSKIMAEKKKTKDLSELLTQKTEDLSSVEKNIELCQSEIFRLHEKIEELFLDKQQWHIVTKNQNDILFDRYQKLEINHKKLFELVKQLQNEKRELKKECQSYAVYNHQLLNQQRPQFDEESIFLKELNKKDQLVLSLNQELSQSQDEISKLKELFSSLQQKYCKDLNELFSSGIEEKVRLEEIIESKEYPIQESLSRYVKLCQNLLNFKNVSSQAHDKQHQTILKLQKKIKLLVEKLKQREDELQNKSNYFDLKNKSLVVDSKKLFMKRRKPLWRKKF